MKGVFGNGGALRLFKGGGNCLNVWPVGS
jgi:hypothetical protein